MGLWVELLGPKRGFDGGLFLPDSKSVTARRPVETVRPRTNLVVPFRARADLQTDPVVSVGDRVLRNQPLAIPLSPDSLPVHAPTSGRIVALTRTPTPADGFLPAAVLEPDGKDAAVDRRHHWAGESLIRQLADCGVMSCRPRDPAHVVLLRAAGQGVTDLIINAMETEPYLAADLRTLVEEPGRIVDMAGELGDALGVRRVIIALAFRHRRVVRRLREETIGRSVEIAPLADLYPQCHAHLLVKTILDRETPPGCGVNEVGAAVLPLSTVRAAAGAFLDGAPQTHTLVTVAGDAVERPGVYRVPIGMSFKALLNHAGAGDLVGALLAGGPLTGTAIQRADTVVMKDTTAVLAFHAKPEASPVPCVRCGWCVEDCPVGLDPTDLMQLESETRINGRQQSLLNACIDCGLCSYVCPAGLPLAATIRRTRRRLSLLEAAGAE